METKLIEDPYRRYICKNCSIRYDLGQMVLDWKYCPMCGAKIVGYIWKEEEEDDEQN